MMRLALALCLAVLAAVPAAQPASLVWTAAAQKEYQQLLKLVQQERWTDTTASAQPGSAALQLATFSAAMLSRLPRHPETREMAQRVQQLREHVVQVNLGKVELDKLLSQTGEDISQETLVAAFDKYMTSQEGMATSLGLESARQLWWTPFATQSGDSRSQLETLWSSAAPLLTRLVEYLRQRPAQLDLDTSVLDCAAQGRCDELVQMALPYPDVSQTVTDLLREKRLSSEQLARLADTFLILLGLPAAPGSLWTQSQFSAAGECVDYADGDKIRLCADGDITGLKSALTLMSDSEYWREAVKQHSPYQDEAFPGFAGALSSCVQLLALQPAVVQQLVYGYGTGRPAGAPVSLYLARGSPPSNTPDAICSGDVGCQQAANWLMETAVTQLLPLGYHMASLRWLEGASTSPAPLPLWQRELHQTLGVAVSGTPAALDRQFYSAERHIAALLAGFSAFQLRQTACPTGTCPLDGSGSAGTLLREVMAQGSQQPWDQLLKAATGMAAPTAAPLVAFFEPLDRLMSPAAPAAAAPLRTMELDDDDNERRHLYRSESHGGSRAAAPRPSACTKINEAAKTEAEKVICQWSDDYNDLAVTTSDRTWSLLMDTSDASMLAEAVADQLMARNSSRNDLLAIDMADWIKDNTSDTEKNLRGQMYIMTEVDPGQAMQDNLKNLVNSTMELYTKYVNLMVCPKDKSTCTDAEKLNIWDLQKAMMSGMKPDESEMTYYWDEYRKEAKSSMAGTFLDYVTRGNKAAVDADLKHYGMFWLQPYGDGANKITVLEEMAATWAPIQPVYEAFVSYVRFQMTGKADGNQEPLPAHLLGDMFAENWVGIYNYTMPYANTSIDITDTLVDKSYDAVKIRDEAITFLNGLKLPDLSANNDFQSNSNWSACEAMQDCAPRAWTSGDDSGDVRVRIPADDVNMDLYETVHTKMAELEYYLEYVDLDAEYRAPANPAFTDAVAGAISLSVLTPTHLKSVGLMDSAQVDMVFWTNFLYRRALQYLAPLPFSYVTFMWQWKVFNGSYNKDNWEHEWWTMREDIQGVRPANRRHVSDADPLGVPAIARDQPGFQRYMSILLQFQLFEELCIKDNQYDPKDNTSLPLCACDLTKNNNIADLITMMQKGNSARWRTLIADNTNNGNLSADAMLHYFTPLVDFIMDEISTNNLKSGWQSNLGDYWGDDDTDNTVPIVVGVVLGVLVLIVLIAYFVVRARRSKE